MKGSRVAANGRIPGYQETALVSIVCSDYTIGGNTMSYDYSDIPALMRRHPDMFTEEEIRDVEEDREEVRICDSCGEYMNAGFYFEIGEYYCSEECMEKAGISRNEYMMYYSGIYPEFEPELWEEGLKLPPDRIEEFCEKHGDGEGCAFYTEWESDPDLVDRLNEARRLEEC